MTVIPVSWQPGSHLVNNADKLVGDCIDSVSRLSTEKFHLITVSGNALEQLAEQLGSHNDRTLLRYGMACMLNAGFV